MKNLFAWPVALLALLGVFCGQSLAAEKPNIPILISDDQGDMDVRSMAAKTCPHLHPDRLAASGFVRRNQAKPWMLYLAFNAPHTRHEPTANAAATSRRKNMKSPSAAPPRWKTGRTNLPRSCSAAVSVAQSL